MSFYKFCNHNIYVFVRGHVDKTTEKDIQHLTASMIKSGGSYLGAPCLIVKGQRALNLPVTPWL